MLELEMGDNSLLRLERKVEASDSKRGLLSLSRPADICAF